MSEELKPCPFCGENPVIAGKLGRFTLHHSCASVKSNIGVGQKNEIIKEWNTRATPDHIVQANERVSADDAFEALARFLMDAIRLMPARKEEDFRADYETIKTALEHFAGGEGWIKAKNNFTKR